MLTRKIAGRVYNYEYCIGREATGGNGFLFALDFAVGQSGSLYVVNKGTDTFPCQGITKCTLDHEVLWDERGKTFAEGQSEWPCSIDVDSQENIYVCDDFDSRIFIYDKEGNFQGNWGVKGSGDGELNSPSGLAFDREDNLYVVDSLNSRVQKFTKDGKFMAKWGSQGSGPGQFNLPWGIAIDKEGHVYVADWKNDRVQKLTPDGQYLASFGKSGTGEGEIREPSGVAVDDEGDVYIVDWGNKRLNIYDREGEFITSFSGDADRLSPWAQRMVDSSPDFTKARQRTDLTQERLFMRPVAVNVDSEGRIMVLESIRHRIQIYAKEQGWVDAQFNL